jgi:hypothetical protein
MKSRKKNTETPKPNTPETIAQCLSRLIAGQIELGSQAIQCNEGTLASLLAYQIFDFLDWSRLHLNECALATLNENVVANLSALKFTDLHQLETYAERHLVGDS